jgi:hypothetical protein
MFAGVNFRIGNILDVFKIRILDRKIETGLYWQMSLRLVLDELCLHTHMLSKSQSSCSAGARCRCHLLCRLEQSRISICGQRQASRWSSASIRQGRSV